MEALVAIGLTANVLQFAQAAGTLLSETKSIRETGSPRSLPELQRLISELNKQTESIHKDLLAKAGDSNLTSEDKNLIDITHECQTAGSSFSNYLDTLIKPSSSGSHFKNAVAGVKYQLVHGKIEEFALKLDRLRNTLTLGSILAFRARTQANQTNTFHHLQRLHEDNETQFTTTTNGLQTLTNLHQDNQSQTEQRLATLDALIRQCLQDIGNLQDTSSRTRETEILTWLNFRQVPWRFDEVPTAYKTTFEWIFEATTCSRRWADFPTHLRGSATKPYFIQGKAGSGKSTLMKHIIDHPSTITYLKEWADTDGCELVITKFFFWNLGTTLQKSATGLLRALLFSVLERHTELIPVVFSDIYQYWDGGALEPNYTELTHAWRSLTHRSASFLKIAIFIDGIDEFEGDHKDVTTFIRSLASNQIKVVVSSRPITACLRAFEDCPSLTLHDFTAHDMDSFVRGNLRSHATMVQLLQRYPAESAKFIHEIRWKAHGVFLWVKLVVKQLIVGLEDGDSLEDLQGRLRLVPDDLRQLYRQMMSKMRIEYQKQAAEIFKLLHLWQTSMFGSIPLATLHYALRPASECHALDVKPLDTDTSAWHVQQLSARIQSRCCGLIEVSQDYSDNMAQAFIHRCVYHIHRTVAEFLASEDVSKEIEVCTKSVPELVSALMAGILARFKVFVSSCIYDALLIDFGLDQYICLYHVLSKQTQENLRTYIDELDEVLSLLWIQYSGPGENWYSSIFFHPTPSELLLLRKSFSTEYMQDQLSIYTFATVYGLVQYLESCCPRHVLEEPTLLVYALHNTNMMFPDQIRATVIFLLQHIVKTHNAEVEQGLFDLAIKSIRNFRPSNGIVLRTKIYPACILIATMLITADSAPQLLQKNPEAGPYLEKVLEDLNNSKALEDQGLARKLSRTIEKHRQQQDLPIHNRRGESPDERPRKRQRISARRATPSHLDHED